MILVLVATDVSARQLTGDILGYLPQGGEIDGWTADEPPLHYRGADLFMLIDGGADIYHEYGFEQVVSAHYLNGQGNSITVEIYEMDSAAAAYGMFSFKSSNNGQVLAIGQEALLEDYYLNFWKGNMLVTIVGSDADPQTRQAVIDMAKAVDRRISGTGQRPALVDMLRQEPVPLTLPTYIRGPIGAMNHYMFDTDDIFRVEEGAVGLVDRCRVMVFQYRDENERGGIYNQAVARLSHNPRFKDGVPHATHYIVTDRNQNMVMISQAGQFIAIVIGTDKEGVLSISNRLCMKLKAGLSH